MVEVFHCPLEKSDSNKIKKQTTCIGYTITTLSRRLSYHLYDNSSIKLSTTSHQNIFLTMGCIYEFHLRSGGNFSLINLIMRTTVHRHWRKLMVWLVWIKRSVKFVYSTSYLNLLRYRWIFYHFWLVYQCIMFYQCII